MARADGLTRKGDKKYDDQVWAGLVNDPERLAELKADRAPKKAEKKAAAAAETTPATN